MAQRFVIRDRVRLAYEKSGGGPKVVLVQGLGLSGRMWLGLAGGLVKNGYTVVTPDSRGTGLSDKPLPPYRMKELASDLAAVIRDAGCERALVVGISLGGMVAQHLALGHPELVGGLVLAATTCGLRRGTQPSLWPIALVAGALLRSKRAVDALRGYLVSRRSLEQNPDLFREWDRQMVQVPMQWRGFLGQLMASTAHDTCSLLHRITCPTEVIVGDADQMIPPESSKIMADRIPGATITLLPGAGHAFPLEIPGALPAAVQRVARRMGVR